MRRFDGRSIEICAWGVTDLRNTTIRILFNIATSHPHAYARILWITSALPQIDRIKREMVC